MCIDKWYWSQQIFINRQKITTVTVAQAEWCHTPFILMKYSNVILVIITMYFVTIIALHQHHPTLHLSHTNGYYNKECVRNGTKRCHHEYNWLPNNCSMNQFVIFSLTKNKLKLDYFIRSLQCTRQIITQYLTAYLPSWHYTVS